MRNNPVRKEKMNRKKSIGLLFQELYKRALLRKIEHYKSIEVKIIEARRKLEDPMGFQADKEVEKVEKYLQEIEGKEVLTKKQILRLFSFRKTLIGIIQNNLGKLKIKAGNLIDQIDNLIGKGR